MNNLTMPLNNLTSNPMFQMAQMMAKGKNPDELKQIAINICKEKGINLEEAYKDFQEFMKMLNKGSFAS